MTSYQYPPDVEYASNAQLTGGPAQAVAPPAVTTARPSWWTPKRRAIFFLMFVSAALAELVSASCPPIEFFNPFTGPMLFIFYGCGAVLARETLIIWNKKGYASLLLLGAAYGILEEGMSVKSWLDPGWMDLGTLGVYGRFWGINTVWAVWLTLYHAVISIAVPILITDMVFPEFKGKRLTSDEGWKGYKGFFVAGTAMYVFVFFCLTPYMPPVPQYALVVGLFLLAIWLAYKVNGPVLRLSEGQPKWSPARFWMLGTFLMTFSFLGFGAGGALVPIPILLIYDVCAMDMAVLLLLLMHIGTVDNNRHLVAFMLGCESIFLFAGFIHEFFTPMAWGMSLVSIGTVVFFLWLYKKAERLDAASTEVKLAVGPMTQVPTAKA